MSVPRVHTRHPQGKTGRTIDRQKYDAVKQALLAALRQAELTHTELLHAVRARLARGFEGNTNWYAETVKLDLEARRVIERTASRPQKYRLHAAGK